MAHHSGNRRLDFTVLDSVCSRRLDFGCTAEKRKEEVGNGRTRLCTRKMDVPFLRDCFFVGIPLLLGIALYQELF